MIIEMLLDMLFNLFSVLTSGMSIPGLPTEVHSFLADAFLYLAAGVKILANYVPLTLISSLFMTIVIVDGALLIYHFALWVIKKVPMLNIK